jgi:hypothetical protein
MRVTIIADDAAVYVDGVARWPIDLTGLSSDIHAVQWYDTYGVVEFRSGQPNAMISDLAPYQAFVDRHAAVQAVPQSASATAPSTGVVRVIAN